MVLAGVAHGLGKAWEVLQEPIELPNDGGPMNAYEIYENGKGGSLPLPATRNVSGRGMGSQIHPITKQPSFHDGIDQAASIGTEIPAVRAGVVRYAGSYRNYGNYVLIDHGNGISTGYAHLKDTYVVIGQKVYQGMSIGTVGMTGMTTGPHLHFNVIKTASITQTSINGRHVSGWIFINPMGAW